MEEVLFLCFLCVYTSLKLELNGKTCIQKLPAYIPSFSVFLYGNYVCKYGKSCVFTWQLLPFFVLGTLYVLLINFLLSPEEPDGVGCSKHSGDEFQEFVLSKEVQDFVAGKSDYLSNEGAAELNKFE
jgi:hypothetical protein